MQGAGHFHKATEDAANKPQKVVALGKVRKRDERRVRRHAQIWTPIPGIARVQREHRCSTTLAVYFALVHDA